MKIFISYASQDKAFVDRLATDLKNQGVDIWIDSSEIKVSDSLISKVSSGLSESGYFIPVLSPNSIASEWFNREISYALMRELETKSNIIYPVLLDSCTIPAMLKDKAYADFRNDYSSGFKALLQSLSVFLPQNTDSLIAYTPPKEDLSYSRDELTGFISYSHKDLKMKNRFLSHLAPLKKLYNINTWYDGLILPGKPVDQSVMHQLRHADIVFILVSADYITSDFCYNVELQEAIKRHEQGHCVVVPVILKPIGVSLRELSFGSLLMVPEDAKPISKFKPLDSGYANAISKIEALLSQHFSKATLTPTDDVLPDVIGLKIYQKGILMPYAVNQTLIDNYPVLCERLTNFTTKVQRYNAAKIQSYSNVKNKSTTWWRRKIDCYFFDFLSYISRDLLGNMTGVRIHIRKLEGANYKGIRAVTLKQDDVMDVKIPTTMPATNSMIEAASRVDAPLIKSFNEEFHCNGSSTEWVDYVTCVFKKLDSGLQPILSLGISINSANYEDKLNWLILFAHTRIDNIIQGLMLDFFSECKHLDHNFDLKTILSAHDKKGGRKNG